MADKSLQCEVLVVGGGPAGMMAAIAAAEAGARTVLLEKNTELGIKLMMTGKGRCNITNAEKDRGKFLEMFGKNGRFLRAAFSDFGPEDTVRFFESKGVATKVERGGRIFPQSDQAADVRRALMEELRQRKVVILRDAEVKELVLKEGNVAQVKVRSKEYDQVVAAEVVIATGGLSYPGSGSSGDGFVWAGAAGHRITVPCPALTPVIVKDAWVAELEGLSLKNVAVSVWQEGRKQDERFGEALFTDKGMSGPVILDMSKRIGELMGSGKVELAIDFKPALEFAELDKRVQKDFAENQNRMFKNSLDGLLPQKLIPAMISRSLIDPEKKVNLVTKEERRRLLHLLKELRLEVKNLLGFDKAVVTAGGVNLREVDPKTMRSKVVGNLYFAGEVLDLDAPTGGYNLQEAWSSGRLAGKSAGERIIQRL